MDNYSFGRVLRRFAFAVDVVDDDVLEQVGSAVGRYVHDELKVEHFEVLREQTVGGEPGLGTLWSSDHGPGVAWPIRNGDDTYTAQVARAYDSGTPLWVVAPDKRPLDEVERYTDLWSDATDLPEYHEPIDNLKAKTSITIPLQHGSRKVGALCLDSSLYLEITPVARTELKLAAEAIATLYANYEATRGARECTRTAIGELQQVLAEAPFRQLTRPHVFLASSGRADKEVVEAITDVLERDEFRNRITPLPWQDNRQTGYVDRQIAEHIREAKFGICYLSEPDEEHDEAGADTGGEERHEYRDNPNVLFEAGMLHGLMEIDYSGGWVPVREEDAAPAPFDIANQNHIIVPRKQDGSLDRPAFEEELCGRVRELLGTDETLE